MAEIDFNHENERVALCLVCDARKKGICGALNVSELAELSKLSRRRLASTGDILIFDDEQIHHFANILQGVVKLSKVMQDGRQQIVGLQFPPDFLGRPFSDDSIVTAEAASEVELCIFPKTALESLLQDVPELQQRLFTQTLLQLDEAREWMVTLGRKTAPERVASFLHLIATHMDPIPDTSPEAALTEEMQFLLPLTRADMADFLGLTIETVSRQITKLRKAGIIDIENHRLITVHNVTALSEACGC